MLFRENCCVRDDERDARRRSAGSRLFPRPDRRGSSRAVAARKSVRFSEANETVRRAENAGSARFGLRTSAGSLGRALRRRKQKAAPLSCSRVTRACSSWPKRCGRFFADQKTESARPGEGRAAGQITRSIQDDAAQRTCSGPTVFGWAWMCPAKRSRTSSSHDCPSRFRIIR